MMTDKDNEKILAALLHDPTAEVEPLWVMQMMKAHPTFIIPALLLLKRNPQAVDDDTRHKLQTLIALNCPDRTALADYIDPNDAGWASFYPIEQPFQSSTEQTIDDFLVTFGQTSTPEEDQLLEKLLFNPTPVDYFANTDEPFDPADPLALPPELRKDDADLEYEPYDESDRPALQKPQKESQEVPTPGDESLLMESLSKIFIKQRRYERAYEIISKLSLKYPEKSVYFADQLRFLQKLIINQRYKNK